MTLDEGMKLKLENKILQETLIHKEKALCS